MIFIIVVLFEFFTINAALGDKNTEKPYNVNREYGLLFCNG
jgi:hypothetical protein